MGADFKSRSVRRGARSGMGAGAVQWEANAAPRAFAGPRRARHGGCGSTRAPVGATPSRPLAFPRGPPPHLGGPGGPAPGGGVLGIGGGRPVRVTEFSVRAAAAGMVGCMVEATPSGSGRKRAEARRDRLWSSLRRMPLALALCWLLVDGAGTSVRAPAHVHLRARAPPRTRNCAARTGVPDSSPAHSRIALVATRPRTHPPAPAPTHAQEPLGRCQSAATRLSLRALTANSRPRLSTWPCFPPLPLHMAGPHCCARGKQTAKVRGRVHAWNDSGVNDRVLHMAAFTVLRRCILCACSC